MGGELRGVVDLTTGLATLDDDEELKNDASKSWLSLALLVRRVEAKGSNSGSTSISMSTPSFEATASDAAGFALPHTEARSKLLRWEMEGGSMGEGDPVARSESRVSLGLSEGDPMPRPTCESIPGRDEAEKETRGRVLGGRGVPDAESTSDGD